MCRHEAILDHAPFVLRDLGCRNIKDCEFVVVYTAEDARQARPPDFLKNIPCAVGWRVFALLSHGGDQAAVGQRPGAGDESAHDTAGEEQDGQVQQHPDYGDR